MGPHDPEMSEAFGPAGGEAPDREPQAAFAPDAAWPPYLPPAAAPPDPPTAATPPAERGVAPGPRIGVVALVAALIGALVGGGVAAGIVAAVDRHRTTTTVITSSGDSTPYRPSTALSRPGDIRAILAKVEPAVVRIDVTAEPDALGLSRSGTGTGFIVDPSGVIVTNAHVVNAGSAAPARRLTVTLSAGDSVPGRLLGEDAAQDLAVVKIDRTNLPTVALGSSDSIQVGDAVVAIGNALGIAGNPTVTSGIVSGLGRTVDISATERLVDAIQTDAAINPGNSGGPLVDVQGRVIGINTAIADPGSSNNIGFAISISSAKPVIAALRAGRTPQIAFMGVQTQTVTPDLARRRHLGVGSGALVGIVTPAAGAARAGLRPGDVIVSVNGVRVTTSDDVLRIVREHRPGDVLSVVAVRGARTSTFRVVLGDLPNA